MYAKLKRLNLDKSPSLQDKFEMIIVSSEFDTVKVKTHRRLKEVNWLVRENRDYFLSLVDKGGAGLFGMERSKRNGLFDDLSSALRLGEAPGEFDFTLLEFQPKSIVDILRIAELFDFDTNVVHAEFEKSDGTSVILTKLIDILNAIDETEKYSEKAA